MSKLAESFAGQIGKLFISIKLCHGLCCLVFFDRLSNLISMSISIDPSVDEVGCCDGWIVCQNLSFGVTQVSSLSEYPDGNTGVGNAGISAASARSFLDSCPGVAEALE